MTKEKSRIDDCTDVADPDATDSIAHRRHRLAQQIGRLLARTWLERRREAEKGDSSAEETPPSGR
jgi:hypothetical protein